MLNPLISVSDHMTDRKTSAPTLYYYLNFICTHTHLHSWPASKCYKVMCAQVLTAFLLCM